MDGDLPEDNSSFVGVLQSSKINFLFFERLPYL